MLFALAWRWFLAEIDIDSSQKTKAKPQPLFPPSLCCEKETNKRRILTFFPKAAREALRKMQFHKPDRWLPAWLLQKCLH